MHTWMYSTEACLTGFRGAQRDANTQMPDVQQQHADEQHCNQELNHILAAHVADSAVTTFGCVEWESQLFRGVMLARCYPFNLPKRPFHFFNPKVCCTLSDTYWYILVHTLYILVHTWSVLSMYKGIPRMILLCCSCAGYCTGCSTISILHRGRSP